MRTKTSKIDKVIRDYFCDLDNGEIKAREVYDERSRIGARNYIFKCSCCSRAFNSLKNKDIIVKETITYKKEKDENKANEKEIWSEK